MGTEIKENIYCPNCGHFLRKGDRYCSNCGQKNTTHKLSVWYFFREFLEHSLNLDTRTYHTLRDLWVPGLITKKFNQNQRKYYLSPLQFYLLVSFVFFLGINSLMQETANTVTVQLSEESMPDSLLVKGRITSMTRVLVTGEEMVHLRQTGDLSRDRVDSLLNEQENPPGWLGRRIVYFGIAAVSGQINFANFLNSLYVNISRVIFLLMPIFALLLAVFFWSNRMYYTEHLVFSLNFHSFLLIFFGICFIGNALFEGLGWNIAALIGVNIYQAIAIRRIYEKSWTGTIVRSFLLSMIYMLFLSFGFLLASIGTMIE